MGKDQPLKIAHLRVDCPTAFCRKHGPDAMTAITMLLGKPAALGMDWTYHCAHYLFRGQQQASAAKKLLKRLSIPGLGVVVRAQGLLMNIETEVAKMRATNLPAAMALSEKIVSETGRAAFSGEIRSRSKRKAARRRAPQARRPKSQP